LDGGAAAEYAELRAAEGGLEAKMQPITWEEKVEARGVELGLEQGLEQGLERGLETGLARGQEKGMREVLLLQLKRRFPSLSSRAVQRLQAITSTEELGSLAERLLTAGSLEELGLA
jgi:flagellar biosynthesis/type III secretory pathway protein FliH